MTGVVKEMLDFYKSRIESPLFFSFVFSWCGFNYEFLYYLMFFPSEGKVQELLDFKFSWLYDFVFPLFASFILLTLMPVLNNLIMQCKYFLLFKTSEGAAKNKKLFDDILEAKELEKIRAQLTVDLAEYKRQKKDFDADYENRKNDKEHAERYMNSLVYYALYKDDRKFITSLPNHFVSKSILGSDIISFTLSNKNNEAYEHLTASLFLDRAYSIESIKNFLSQIERNKEVSLEGTDRSITGTVVNIQYRATI